MNERMLILIAAAAGAYFFIVKKPSAAGALTGTATNGAVNANGKPVVPSTTVNVKGGSTSSGSGGGKAGGFGLGGSLSSLSLDVPKLWKNLFGGDSAALKAAKAQQAADELLVQNDAVVREYQVGDINADPPSESKVPDVPVPQLVDPGSADTTPDFGNDNPNSGFDFVP